MFDFNVGDKVSILSGAPASVGWIADRLLGGDEEYSYLVELENKQGLSDGNGVEVPVGYEPQGGDTYWLCHRFMVTPYKEVEGEAKYILTWHEQIRPRYEDYGIEEMKFKFFETRENALAHANDRGNSPIEHCFNFRLYEIANMQGLEFVASAGDNHPTN